MWYFGGSKRFRLINSFVHIADRGREASDPEKSLLDFELVSASPNSGGQSIITHFDWGEWMFYILKRTPELTQ